VKLSRLQQEKWMISNGQKITVLQLWSQEFHLHLKNNQPFIKNMFEIHYLNTTYGAVCRRERARG